ncbi:MAG: hypothetical protein OEW00_04185 [candidate division Zixibacteria bacterium]|nr:hypothetical protein [candidate division Zixibacteria bacterium]
MKHKAISVLILMSSLLPPLINAQQGEFPVLKGLYLGQKPPGLIPEIFMPGIVSTELNEHGAPTFSPDLLEMYWSPQYMEIGGGRIIFMSCVDSQWQSPRTASFSQEFKNQNPFLSLDGQRLFFKSFRPIDADVYRSGAFWVTERATEGWSIPKPLGTSVNSGSMGQQITESGNRNLYFAAERPGGKGLWDIYTVPFEHGSYAQAQNLGDAINTEFYESSPYIAPDESYLIFSSLSRPDSYGGSDLYISLRKSDGSWTTVSNMGGVINSKGHEEFPIGSPDEKYLFFFREGDIYWVDMRITEKLKSNDSVQNENP